MESVRCSPTRWACSDFGVVVLLTRASSRWHSGHCKNEAQEQTLRTIVDHVVVRHGDYRDLFTTPHTFLTVDLAALYAVPLNGDSDRITGQPQRWLLEHRIRVGDPRAGLLLGR